MRESTRCSFVDFFAPRFVLQCEIQCSENCEGEHNTSRLPRLAFYVTFTFHVLLAVTKAISCSLFLPFEGEKGITGERPKEKPLMTSSIKPNSQAACKSIIDTAVLIKHLRSPPDPTPKNTKIGFAIIDLRSVFQ